MTTPPLKALGHKVTSDNFEGLETIDLRGPLARVIFTSDEVTAVCPVTGQPDQYKVTIIFLPIGLSIESKSLKLYLQGFRNKGIFAESLAQQILSDILAIMTPRRIVVEVEQKSRGGITLQAAAKWPQDTTPVNLQVMSDMENA